MWISFEFPENFFTIFASHLFSCTHKVITTSNVLYYCVFIGKVGPKDHQRFQASYATILKAHMTAIKKRERKDKKKPAKADKREGSSKRLKRS